MRANGRLSLILAALVGGAAVHVALEACGSVGTAHDARMEDTARGESAPITPSPYLSDWRPYTPTLVGNETGATIGNQISTGQWRRVGDTVELRITTTFSGPPTGTCSDFWVWGLPPGVSLDMSKNFAIAGNGRARQGGKGNVQLNTFAVASGGIAAQGADDCFVTASVPFALDTNGSVSLAAAVPVAGWSATY